PYTTLFRSGQVGLADQAGGVGEVEAAGRSPVLQGEPAGVTVLERQGLVLVGREHDPGGAEVEGPGGGGERPHHVDHDGDLFRAVQVGDAGHARVHDDR